MVIWPKVRRHYKYYRTDQALGLTVGPGRAVALVLLSLHIHEHERAEDGLLVPRPPGRGLHSSAFRLIVTAFC
jgi:hypothetical protein